MYKIKKKIRELQREAIILSRRLASAPRETPGAIIIGGQKCGTTSLFNYLSQHPGIFSGLNKEVHFFDLNYTAGFNWYQAHFPLTEALKGTEDTNGWAAMTLEASPYYLFHPMAAERVHRHLPDTKLIAMLRNPTDRAYSHYWHEYNRGYEPLSLDEALSKESERLEGEAERIAGDPGYKGHNHQHYSYVARGLYAAQLRVWLKYFPIESFVFVQSETFFQDPRTETDRVLNFLEMPSSDRIHYRPVNMGRYDDMDAALRARLDAFYAPHNKELAEMIDMGLDW
jgi:hypothetical protein